LVIVCNLLEFYLIKLAAGASLVVITLKTYKTKHTHAKTGNIKQNMIHIN
jgi:hypothetical protein